MPEPAALPQSRRYDSPVRRARMQDTRRRILDAASELVHEFESWDWSPLTVRAVAKRAGVGERTVYRHFPTERALHESVMQRLGEESGVRYEDLTIDGIAEIGARVFTSMATFAAPSWMAEVRQHVFVAEDARRKAALLAAIDGTVEGWTPRQRALAAAGLDVLWNAPSYARLVTGWGLDGSEATQVIDWMIGILVDAIRTNRRPGGEEWLSTTT